MAKKEKATETTDTQSAKQVIDGIATNAFRVVGVGSDIVIESFYIYPDFSKIQDKQATEFHLNPNPDSEPNVRMILNRDTAIRLAQTIKQTVESQGR